MVNKLYGEYSQDDLRWIFEHRKLKTAGAYITSIKSEIIKSLKVTINNVEGEKSVIVSPGMIIEALYYDEDKRDLMYAIGKIKEIFYGTIPRTRDIIHPTQPGSEVITLDCSNNCEGNIKHIAVSNIRYLGKLDSKNGDIFKGGLDIPFKDLSKIVEEIPYPVCAMTREEFDELLKAREEEKKAEEREKLKKQWMKTGEIPEGFEPTEEEKKEFEAINVERIRCRLHMLEYIKHLIENDREDEITTRMRVEAGLLPESALEGLDEEEEEDRHEKLGDKDCDCMCSKWRLPITPRPGEYETIPGGYHDNNPNTYFPSTSQPNGVTGAHPASEDPAPKPPADGTEESTPKPEVADESTEHNEESESPNPVDASSDSSEEHTEETDGEHTSSSPATTTTVDSTDSHSEESHEEETVHTEPSPSVTPPVSPPGPTEDEDDVEEEVESPQPPPAEPGPEGDS